MNIIFVTIAWPQTGSTNLYSDLLGEFVKKGHNVFVLHGAGRQQKIKSIYYKENEINVLRVKTGNIAKTRPLIKFISLLTLGFKLKNAYDRYYPKIEFDLVLFATPPITLSNFLKKIKKKHKAKFYLLLKDIWPYGFADLGVIKRNGLIWRFFRCHEKRIYRIADHIGCMSPMGVDFVLNKNPKIPKDKVEVCPNAIKIPTQNPKKNKQIRKKYHIPSDSTVFLFSGNIGKGHGVEFLAKNIIFLSHYKKAFFLIGGAGMYFNKIKNILEKANLTNAFIYSHLPQKDFEELIGYL